jgi:hypothetical protein
MLTVSVRLVEGNVRDAEVLKSLVVSQCLVCILKVVEQCLCNFCSTFSIVPQRIVLFRLWDVINGRMGREGGTLFQISIHNLP